MSRKEVAPVQVEGSDLCVVSLQINKVEDVLWSLLIPLLPDIVHAHKHTRKHYY